MNCGSFQNQVYEYVEGTLSADARATAEDHIARCDACRLTVDRERQFSRFLAEGLGQRVEILALRPEVRRRITAAASRPPASSPGGESVVGLWRRLAWPLSMAAALLILAVLRLNHFSAAPIREAATAGANVRADHSVVSIQVSYTEQVPSSHQHGDQVMDTLADKTVVITGTLSGGGQPPARED